MKRVKTWPRQSFWNRNLKRMNKHVEKGSVAFGNQVNAS